MNSSPGCRRALPLRNCCARLKARGSVHMLGLLKLAMRLRREVKVIDPDPAFVQTAEIRILNQITPRADPDPAVSNPPRVFGILQRSRVRVGLALCLILALLFGTVGVVDASAASLPGDRLYPIKRSLEQVQLALTLDDAADVALMWDQVEERLSELEQLTASGRYDDLSVAVDGYLEGMERWEEGQQAMGEAEPGNPEEQQGLSSNVETLQRVLEQVPTQAQAAVQRALDRALEHTGDQPSDAGRDAGREEQSDRRDEREQEQLAHHAEQIAQKYDVSVEAVLAVYQGECGQNWGCVRSFFRSPVEE